MTHRDVAGNLQVNWFPDARIAVWNKGYSVALLLPRPLVAQIFPVQPVKPAVGQLNAVDILNRSFRRDLYCKDIAFPRLDPLRHVEFMRGVHANYLLAVRDLMAIQPDLGAVVNARKPE